MPRQRALKKNSKGILEKNAQDIADAKGNGQGAAFIERLSLGEKGVRALAATLRSVAGLALPAEIISEWEPQKGLRISKVRVPLGAMLLIFESRPDVVVEGAALAIKSGNGIVLKGGKEAARTNAALARIMREALGQCGLPQDAVQLFDGSRDGLKSLLKRSDCIDLVVPRGGEGLINFVRENSQIPVLYAGGGVCHLYVHNDADLGMAAAIAVNAKVQKPSACNAIETLLVHEGIMREFLPIVGKELAEKGVEMRCCGKSLPILKAFGARAAVEPDWGTEFLAPILAVKVVSGVEEAVEHINRHGTRHSEAIVTCSREAAGKFCGSVDAACTYWNASTRFTDGGQFGFGAELGISTQKLHVRGPIGLEALCTYKYKIRGNGNIRG